MSSERYETIQLLLSPSHIPRFRCPLDLIPTEVFTFQIFPFIPLEILSVLPLVSRTLFSLTIGSDAAMRCLAVNLWRQSGFSDPDSIQRVAGKCTLHRNFTRISTLDLKGSGEEIAPIPLLDLEFVRERFLEDTGCCHLKWMDDLVVSEWYVTVCSLVVKKLHPPSIVWKEYFFPEIEALNICLPALEQIKKGKDEDEKKLFLSTIPTLHPLSLCIWRPSNLILSYSIRKMRDSVWTEGIHGFSAGYLYLGEDLIDSCLGVVPPEFMGTLAGDDSDSWGIWVSPRNQIASYHESHHGFGVQRYAEELKIGFNHFFILVDLDRGVLELAVNGKSYGVVFDGVRGPVVPAISVHYNWEVWFVLGVY